MTPDEAREAAWQNSPWPKELYFYERGQARTTFEDGWDARGRYDEQRIAELVTVGQEIWQWANSAHSAYQSPATQMREAAMWQRLGSALSALRALGQSEEVKP